MFKILFGIILGTVLGIMLSYTPETNQYIKPFANYANISNYIGE